MTISVWRYSHLALAVSSFLFIALAAITGCILAVEPIAEKIPSYRVHNFDKITVAEAVTSLRKTYPEISDITVDANQFVTVKGSDADGKNVLAYADARTGKILGFPGKQSQFFQWVTSLHRSLFLHEIGRLFVGLSAFLLLLIAVSGTVLVIQRQRGMKRFFKRIVKESFAQYYHVVLGRLSLIPIIVIALTGTYLSLNKFGFFKKQKIKHHIDFAKVGTQPKIKPAEFAIFQQLSVADVQTIEFPFSDDPEDYYTLKLKNRELLVSPVNGAILSEVPYPITTLLNNLSLNLHTGRASAIWAVVLGVASLNILFFIYSGFVITLKRRANRVKKNKYSAENAEFVILVGSENGSTFRYGNAIHQQLLQKGKKSFITELNNYTSYPQATSLLLLTATYGLGDAPTNAARFARLLERKLQQHPIKYSILGFGSHAYPDFCKFAFEVNQLMAHQQWAEALIDIHTVNDKSPEDVALWAEAWAQQTGINLNLNKLSIPTAHDLKKLTVVSNTAVGHAHDTFLLRLKPLGRIQVKSGDLLAVYPADDHRERLYSIGVINQEIQLSVRLHPNGLGSGFLSQLSAGQTIRARVVNNPHFHFPLEANAVVMISNGTGIAPFLGMIDQNNSKIPCHLYGGFRDQSSINTYKTFLDDQRALGRLLTLSVALSRAGEKQYVSDLLEKDSAMVANILQTGGVLMICGSLAMQKDVLALLETICLANTNQELSFYQSHSQIMMDCY